MKREGWSKAAVLRCLAKARGSLELPKHASLSRRRSECRAVPFLRTDAPSDLKRSEHSGSAGSHAGIRWASATKRLALRLAQVPRGAARPRTVTWPNQQPALAVLFQPVLRPRGRPGGGAGEGAGLYVAQWRRAQGRRGGARCAAQGRAAKAPMSVRRVRGRLVRETPGEVGGYCNSLQTEGACEGPGVRVVLLAVWVRARRVDLGARAAGAEGQRERG